MSQSLSIIKLISLPHIATPKSCIYIPNKLEKHGDTETQVHLFIYMDQENLVLSFVGLSSSSFYVAIGL